jgi:hypothetical protein
MTMFYRSYVDLFMVKFLLVFMNDRLKKNILIKVKITFRIVTFESLMSILIKKKC